MRALFSWGNRAEILKTLRTSVWSDEVVRMLIAEGIHCEGMESKVCCHGSGFVMTSDQTAVD